MLKNQDLINQIKHLYNIDVQELATNCDVNLDKYINDTKGFMRAIDILKSIAPKEINANRYNVYHNGSVLATNASQMDVATLRNKHDNITTEKVIDPSTAAHNYHVKQHKQQIHLLEHYGLYYIYNQAGPTMDKAYNIAHEHTTDFASTRTLFKELMELIKCAKTS